jgi:hypothetical protein
MQLNNIDNVINALGEIVEECRQENSQLGYFPALYRKTTIQVKMGLENGRFDNAGRLEELDIVFARRYIEAYRQHRRGIRPTRAWEYSFQMAQADHPLIMQHLLLGMNAHINLDLGIAAADVCPGEELIGLRRDFYVISDILEEMIDWVQAEINTVSPLLAHVDTVGVRLDEFLCNFGIRKARLEAWAHAEEMAFVSQAQRQYVIRQRDKTVSVLARLICPGARWNPVVGRIRAAELLEPRAVIDVLF